MSKYSNVPYHGAVYGETPKSATSAEPMDATALSYLDGDGKPTTVRVNWHTPYQKLTYTSNILVVDSNTIYNKLRLVRSQDAYPETPEDGAPVWEWTLVPGGNSTVNRTVESIDDGLEYSAIPITAGKYIYYRMWMRLQADNTWIDVGSTYTLVPKEHGTKTSDGTILLSTHDKVMDLLPRVFTSASQSPIDEVDPTSTLYAFLKSFSFTYDEIMTFADLLVPEASGKTINPNMLAAQADHVGITQGGSMVSKSQKRLIREAIYIYSRKGTPLSLGTLAESITGFAPTVINSPNLFLSNQDSSFNKSAGHWSVQGNCTLTVDNTTYPPDSTIAPLALERNYTAKVVVGTANASIANGFTSPMTLGVPVTPSASYVFSMYSKIDGGVTGATITPKITWYDFQGVQVGAVTTLTAATQTASWARTSASATAPSTARFATFTLTFSNVATYHLDMLQFEVGLSASTFQEARGITLQLDPVRTNLVTNPSFEASSGTVTVRTNLVTNPSFEVDVTNWNSYTATSYVRSTAQSFSGTASSLVTANGTNIAGVYNGISPSLMPVTAGQPYTWSIYVRDVNTALQYKAGINWQTSAFANISDSTGTATTVTSSGWTRVTVTGTAPVNATYAQPWCRTATAPASGTQVYFDAALFEQSSVLGSYFDGSRQPALRENLVINPGLDSGTPYIGSNNSSFQAISTAQAYVGAGSLLGTANGAGGFGYYPQTVSAGRLPVQPNTPYSWSVYVRDLTTTKQFVASIEWYTSSGSFISTISGTATTVTTSGWTRVTVTGTSPATAALATPTIYTSTTPAAGTQAYFDAMLFEKSSTVGAYFDGTTTAANGSSYTWTGTANASTSISYDSDFSVSWSGTANASTSLQTGVGVAGIIALSPVVRSTDWASNGSYSARIIPLSSTTGTDTFLALGGDIGGIRLGMVAGNTYTVSATIRLTAAQTGNIATTRARRIVFFYNAGAGYVETASAAAPNSAGSTRLNLTFTVPLGATEAFIRLYNGTDSGGGDVWWDSVMLEQSSTVNPYFDGSIPFVNGVMWSGTANASTSVVYPNWPTKIALLSMYMNNNMPSNTPYSINLLGTTPLTGITQ